MIRWMIFEGRDLFWFSFAGKFLREPFCRVAPRPCTPGLLSFHEESNQRRAKGTSPRELCCAKLSPPVCSDSGQMLGHLPTTSGSRYLHRCQSAPAAGGCPILAHHFGQQAVMSLQSITKGKAFGALSCDSIKTALLPLSISFFYCFCCGCFALCGVRPRALPFGNPRTFCKKFDQKLYNISR